MSDVGTGRIKRWLKRVFIVGLVALALVIGCGTAGFVWLEARLPDVFSFAAYRRLAWEHSRVHAAGGELIARFGPQVRTVVPLERIPDTALYAVVCAEDAAFFHHPGLDLLGIARALWIDVTERRYAQGASTITQQFAKTRFLSSRKTISRKLKELVLARKLEQKLSKQDILAMYVNEIYFGHGRYGIEEASRFFFGKPVGQVDVAEAAMLAGVVNSPARFSPLRHPEAARKRRAYVLGQMHRRGYISAADAARADAAPLPSRGHGALDAEAPWFARHVRHSVRKRLGRELLRHGGLRIEVALDVPTQRAAEEAVRAGLRRADERYRVHRPLRHYRDKKAMDAGLKRLRKRQKAAKAGPGRILLGVVRGYDKARKAWLLDLGDVRANLPEAALERYRGLGASPSKDKRAAAARANEPGDLPALRTGDLIRVSIAHKDKDGIRLVPEFGPQAALFAIEPKSRLVRAVIGGDNFYQHPFDRSRLARRQPGSTFKTFVYGAALESGVATADTEVVDARRTHISHGRPWTPRNYSGEYDGNKHTLRDALARSINSIAVEVAERVSPAKVAEFATRAGIRSPLSADLPLALGASAVNPAELANAYATIASGGEFAEPIFVTRVVDRFGRELFSADARSQRVISERVALALTDMLGEVVRRGSGRSARVGRPVAGKTGTSNRGRDTWFVGFSPRLCAAVWVGHDDRKPMHEASGSRLALPIWADFMRTALERVPVMPLPRLPHVLAAVTPPPEALNADPEAGADAFDDGRLEPPVDEDMPPPLEGEIIDESALEKL